MKRERISFTFDPRDMLLSLQMGFSFVRAAVACAILGRTSGLEPSSETTAPRYLKLVTVPNFCPFTFTSLWMPLALFVISLVFSALISILYLVQVLSRLSTKASSSCSSSASASMSSANRRLVIFLPPMLTFPSCSRNVEDGGWQKTSLPYSDCCSEPFSYAAIHLDCSCSLVRAAQWCELDLHWYCTSAWWPIRLHAILCQRLFWNQWRHGTDSADVGGTFHTGF